MLVLAFALRWGLAVALPNIHRPDEIFQNLEPALRMWSGGGVVTWEWRDGIRSPIFPGFLAGVIGVSAWLGLGAAGYLAAISAVLSLISTAVVAVAYLVGGRRAGLAGALIASLLCALWPDMVYFGPKPLTEIQAGNLLVIGAFLADFDPGSSIAAGATPGDRDRRLVRTFLAGTILGLVFCVRFQLAPAILLVAAWTCRLDFRRWSVLAIAVLIPIIAMGLIDWLFWGSFLCSVWRNFQANIVQRLSEAFGVKPPYWYVFLLVHEWGAAVVPIGVAFVVGSRKAPLLSLIAAVVLLSHSLVPHKEFSFVYAAIPPVLIVAGLGTAESLRFLTQTIGPALGSGKALAAAAAFWIATSAGAELGADFPQQWLGHAAVLRAEEAARRDPQLCGLGLRAPKVLWYWSGGDAFLGRPIPIYAFISNEAAARVAPAIDFAIGGDDVADGLAGFAVVGCWRELSGDKWGDRICLARSAKSHSCVRDPNLEINNSPNFRTPGDDLSIDELK